MATILTDLAEGVQTVTLNHPEALNALSLAMVGELGQAVRAAERDDTIRALVITGAGRAFSAGADINEFRFAEGPPDLGEELRSTLNPLMARVHALEKPVLAAINGVAAGAGMSLALVCDLRFAAESARLVLAFVRIGLVPDSGLFYFLPRLIGPAKTLELAWTFDAQGDVLPAQGITLPVYHSWQFATGPAGSFETLVRRIRPRALPPESTRPAQLDIGAPAPSNATRSGCESAPDQ